MNVLATRGNMVSTLRGKATNIASRGSRVQSIHGFMGITPVSYSGGPSFKTRLENRLSSLRFQWISSGPSGRFRDSASNKAKDISSFPNHWSAINLRIIVMLAELLPASLNKH
jgi:hypothetical protein